MIWALAQGGAMAGGSLMNWLNARKNRTPEFHRTRTGQYMAKMSREGAYGNETRRRLMDATTKAVSNRAQMGKSSMLGYLEARGMRDSVAGAKMLNEQDLNVQRVVGDQADRIETENEQTKVDAMMRYVQGADASSDARRRETAAANAGLIGGLTGAVGTAYGTVQAERRHGLEMENAEARTRYYKAMEDRYAKDSAAPEATISELIRIADPFKRVQWAKERGIDPDYAEEMYWLHYKGGR